MSAAKKFRKKTRMEVMEFNHRKLIGDLIKARANEAAVVRALYEVAMGGSEQLSKYAENFLVQTYGKESMEWMDKEIKNANKKAKGLDKVILTGTEAMEQ